MENKNSAASALLSIDGEDVTTWALPEGAIARLGRGSVRGMALSPDGQHFAVGTNIGLWLYDLPTLSPIALWETDRGFSDRVTFSPDGRWIAAHPREALTVWDIQNESCIAEMEFRDRQDRRDLSKPVFSKDGERLVVFSGHQQRMKKILSWCPHTGTRLSETEIPSAYDVYPICFSPDLSLLAGTSYDRNNRTAEFIAVWDVETAEQIARLEWSERWGRLCFSPCGRFLAAGGSEGTIQVWDIETGNLEETYTEDKDAQMHPYYPPEGGLIAAVVFPSQSKIEIQHLEKGEKLDEFEHRGNRSMVRFSDSGTQLALASSSEIQIWTKGNNSDAHTISTLSGHITTVDTLVFSADEKTLASASWGDNVLLWDIRSKNSYHPQGEKLPASSHNVYRSPSGKMIAINVYGDTLNVLEVGKREPLAELTGLEGRLGRAKAFSPTGHRIASVDTNNNIHIWECSDGESWKKHTTVINDEEFTYGLLHSPTGLAFSPDGKQLASISRSRDWKAGLWNVDTGERIAELPLTPAPRRRSYREADTGIAFSPDGNIIAGGLWHEIVFWDATDGKTLMTIPQSEENQRSVTLCFSPCSRYLAAGAWWKGGLKKVSICLWEVATGKNIATFKGHTTDVQCFAFSQDGTLLVSGGHDGAIYLWDLTPYL
ncbi:hypothetical protein F4Y93_08975 [Candidatus Poribacteria bacterium]|nr:hypothetical protein [Candidatus Poribacteria bacterium]